MKIYIILKGLLVVLTNQINGQIKYEGEIDSKLRTIQPEDGSFKYLKYNKKEEKVSIYNIDNTIWRSIKLPLPKSHLLDEIIHVSQYTFNQDDFVELAYTCVVYNPNNNFYDPEEDLMEISFTLNIVSESGKHLLKVEDSNDMKIINSKGKKKLLVYKHEGTHFKGEDKTLIYSF